MSYIKNIQVFFLTVLLTGCVVSTESTVMGGPAPSKSKMESRVEADAQLPTTVAVLPFINETESEFAYTVVRHTMINHFSTRNYRMLHWQDIDNRLALAGLTDASDISNKPADELRQILGVDGLIYGNITHYNKTFAGIYSQIAVGVELRFVNANSETIWEVHDVRRSHAGGISTTPVGLIMNALVSAKHIYGDINLYRAADELGRDLANEIPQPETVDQRTKPAITNVVHSAVGQYLTYGDTVEFGIEGASGMTAVVSIDGIGSVDLMETEPGQYVGKLSIDKTLNVNDMTVVGRLQDDFGQISSWISPYGLINIDNTPPAKVSNLQTESRHQSLRLNWDAPHDKDIASYLVSHAITETGKAEVTLEVANSEATLEQLQNFQTIYVSVSAVDTAGNIGDAVLVEGIAAEDSRFGSATQLSSIIPSTVSGINRLTLQGSPYSLNGKVKIATDGILLIAPGVHIIVSQGAKLSVLGEIHSFGNKEHPVIVNAKDDQLFDEFLILQSTLPISLRGLTVTQAGIPIQITAGTPLIEACTLVDSAYNAIIISGTARPIIKDCIISGAKASGVIVSGQSQPTFDNNEFDNNEPFHLQNGSTYEVDLRTNKFEPAASGMTIFGEAIY